MVRTIVKCLVLASTAVVSLGCINVTALHLPPPPIAATNCPGCALLSVSLNTMSTGTIFSINLTDSADLSGATITFRACVLSGTPQTILQPFIKNGGPSYTNLTDPLPFSSVSACSSGFQDV